MSLDVPLSFMKSLSKLHPKMQGQVAVQILSLAAGLERSDWGPYHAHGTERITVGENRIEIQRNAKGLAVIALLKRNDGYKP